MAKLTDPQLKKREHIVKAMKRNTDDFKKRYGDDAKSVMYATATKLSKNESVQYAVEFNTSDEAISFANTLKKYGIAKNEYISTTIDKRSEVVFESKIENNDFLDWLSCKEGANGMTLYYEDLLPSLSNFTDPDEITTFRDFRTTTESINYDVLFKDAISESADDAYKKTKAYKKLKGDDKAAVDYFMQELDRKGANKLETILKDTKVRFNIKPSLIDDFLENIFFEEDVQYFKASLSEESEVSKTAQKEREAAEKKNEKDRDKATAEKTEKQKASKEAADKKADDVEKRETEATAQKTAQQAAASGAGAAAPKTFANFKSDLKPGEKGKPSITEPESEKEIKLETPPKGSPIKDAVISDKDDDEIDPIGEEKNENNPLNKPFRTPGGPKKFSVYVKNKAGNIVKVNFGDPDMDIKRDSPERRKAFNARHNCSDKTDPTTPGYWSCKMWQKGKSVSDMTNEEIRLKDGGSLPKGYKVKWKGADKKDVWGEIDYHGGGHYIDSVKVTKSNSKFYKAGNYAYDVDAADIGLVFDWD